MTLGASFERAVNMNPEVKNHGFDHLVVNTTLEDRLSRKEVARVAS